MGPTRLDILPEINEYRRMITRTQIGFYGFLPLSIALLSGLRGTIYAPDLPAWKGILFWAVCGFFFWIVAGYVYWLMSKSGLNSGPKKLTALVLSGFTSMCISYFFVGSVIQLSYGFFPGFETLIDVRSGMLKDGFWSFVFGRNAFGGILTFSAAVLIRDRMLTGTWLDAADRINDRHNNAHTPGTEKFAPPVFLTKTNPRLGQNLVALQAQEHYLKVYTDTGSELILYRFGDAITELKNWPGLRVHRSFWVAKNAITGVEPKGRSYELTLNNGLRIPVSQSYRSALEIFEVL